MTFSQLLFTLGFIMYTCTCNIVKRYTQYTKKRKAKGAFAVKTRVILRINILILQDVWHYKA